MKKIKLIIFGIIAVLLLGFGVYFIIASSQSSVKMKILYTSVFKTKPDDSKANFDGVHAFLQSGNSENTDYIFSIFQKDSETKQSGQPSGGATTETDNSASINGLSFKATDMTKSVNFATGSSTGISIDGVPLYSGNPWTKTSGWYGLDKNKADSYLNKYLGTSYETYSGAHTDNNSSRSNITVDGVTCFPISWYPIMSMCDVENGSPVGWSRSSANKWKGVAILEKGGNTYYLPICSGGDNKGHTWPGGFAQTYITNGTTANSTSVVIPRSDGNAIKWNGSVINSNSFTYSELLNYSTALTYNGGSVSSPKLGIEANSAKTGALRGYTLLGFYWTQRD